MATETTVTVSVIRYTDGTRLGSVPLPAAEWESYVDCTHPDYQWPEGISEAGDVLTELQLAELGCDARTVIWLE